MGMNHCDKTTSSQQLVVMNIYLGILEVKSRLSDYPIRIVTSTYIYGNQHYISFDYKYQKANIRSKEEELLTALKSSKSLNSLSLSNPFIFEAGNSVGRSLMYKD